MPKPTIGQVNWGDDLNDYLDSEAVKVARVDPGTTGSPGQTPVRSDIGDGTEWVNGLLNIMAYGAVNNGTTTDDTAAFDAAWADAIANRMGLYIPPGHFYYTGTGLSGNLYPTIVGAGRGVSRITLGSTSYLLRPASADQTQTLLLRDLNTIGGYGAIQHLRTSTNVQGEHVVENCWFYQYTRAAVEANASDFPYWKFRNTMFWGLDNLLTMGIALPGLTDQDAVIDCAFHMNRVSLKLYGGGDNAEIVNNAFLRFSADRANGPCYDIWIVPEPTATNSGQGLIIRDNKFGNETLGAGDDRILVADQSAGTTFGQQWPNTGADSTGYVYGVTIADNYWASNSSAANDAFIYSTTPNLQGWRVGPLTASGVFRTNTFVEYRTPPTAPDRLNQANILGPILPGGEITTSTEQAPNVTNSPTNWKVIDPTQILHTQPGFAREGTGTPANYADLLAGSGIRDFTYGVLGSAKTDITDALGLANAANVSLPNGNTGIYEPLSAMTPGVPVWVEFDVSAGSSTPMDRLIVAIANSTVNYHFKRTVEVPSSGWHTYKFSFVPASAGSSLNMHFANQTGSTGEVKIGRVRCYHATEQVPGGHVLPTYTVTNVTTDRTFDADTVAVAELADIVGTLIADLKAKGL